MDNASESESASPQPKVSRRGVLKGVAIGAVGAAALVGAGAIGYGLNDNSAPPETEGESSSAKPVGDQSLSFRTRPDLSPPRVTVTRGAVGEVSPGYLLLTPSLVPGARGVDEKSAIARGLGQEGVMIVDSTGALVWFENTPDTATNLQVQSFRGNPALTYWVGSIENGIGFGKGVILDGSYQQLATVKAGNGLQADLHELVLTPSGTALITAYRQGTADLSSVGGAKNGAVWESVVQEVEPDSGHVLFEWNSLDHVPVSETMAKPTGGAFDYFHINSISLDGEDELLVSARNTWTIYRIDRRSGKVISRLGGKKSDYALQSGAAFAWQHHSRAAGAGRISLFDDQAAPQVGPQSRGLILEIDDAARSARVAQSFTHPARLLTGFEGSTQLLPNGNVLVGWGGQPYATEFDANGGLVLDARLPTDDQSYRAFNARWVGRPSEAPVLVAEADTLGTFAAYVSWNGATEVASWQILSGTSTSLLSPVATVARSGFETAVTVRPSGSLLVAAALDGAGNRLGVSPPVTVQLPS